jgi:hypothetical protein
MKRRPKTHVIFVATVIGGLILATFAVLYEKQFPPEKPIVSSSIKALDEKAGEVANLITPNQVLTSEELNAYKESLQTHAVTDAPINSQVFFDPTKKEFVFKTGWDLVSYSLETKKTTAVKRTIEDRGENQFQIKIIWSPTGQDAIFLVPYWAEHYAKYESELYRSDSAENDLVAYVYSRRDNRFHPLPKQLESVSWSPNGLQFVAFQRKGDVDEGRLLLFNAVGKKIRIIENPLVTVSTPDYAWLANDEIIELNLGSEEITEQQPLVSRNIYDARRQQVLAEDADLQSALVKGNILFYTATKGNERYLYAINLAKRTRVLIATIGGAEFLTSTTVGAFIVYGQPYSWDVAELNETGVGVYYHSQADNPPEVVGVDASGDGLYLVELETLIRVPIRNKNA